MREDGHVINACPFLTDTEQSSLQDSFGRRRMQELRLERYTSQGTSK